MSRSSVFLACLLSALAVVSLSAAEPTKQELPVVGYVVPVPSDDDNADAPDTGAFCVRNGERLAAEEGMPLCAGDELVSSDNSAVGIAFVDDSAVTLRPSSRLVINDYAYPGKRRPTHLELKDGCAFFSVHPRPDDSHFFVRSPQGTLEVKGTKFELTTKVLNGVYDTTVRVTNGTISLTPSGSDAIDISSGTQLLLHVITGTVMGAAPAPMTITKNNLTAKQMKAAEAGAIAIVKVDAAKNGRLTVTSKINNSDGTTSNTRVTEISGVRTLLVYRVTDPKKKLVESITETKTSFSYFEDNGKSKINEKVSGPKKTGRLSATLLNTYTGTGKAEVFTGTDSMSADGTLTGHGVNKTTGDTVDAERKILADGTVVKTQTYQLKQADGQIQTVVFVTQLFVDGSTTKTTAVFPPGTSSSSKATAPPVVAPPFPPTPPGGGGALPPGIGTQTTVHTGTDGIVTTYTASVIYIRLPDGTFQIIPGTEKPIGGALPPLTPPSKIIETNTTRIENPELPVSH